MPPVHPARSRLGPLDAASAAPNGPSCARPEPMDLRSLFLEHYGSIWRLLRRLGVDATALDDAAQEVFWVAARRLEDIRPGSERPFLYGVALRVASNERRRRRSSPVLTSVDQLPQLSDGQPSPEDHLEHRRARELLDHVLDQLAPDLCTVFVLFELEGLEVRQIAEIEQIPIGTVGSRLRRARSEFATISNRVRARLLARGGGF